MWLSAYHSVRQILSSWRLFVWFSTSFRDGDQRNTPQRLYRSEINLSNVASSVSSLTLFLPISHSVIHTVSLFAVPPQSKVNSRKHLEVLRFETTITNWKLLRSPPRWQQWWSTDICFVFFPCFVLQIWSRPCDLLVRFHRRAWLPERQRDPAQRLLPHWHCHSVPWRPPGLSATRARKRTVKVRKD